jgi:hypothetical protein
LTRFRPRGRRIAARTTGCLGLDFSYRFFERQPLAGYVRLAQRRLYAAQLRKEGSTRSIV